MRAADATRAESVEWVFRMDLKAHNVTVLALLS